MQMNYIRPHLICLTEHHLKESEIIKFSLDGYKLASSFCRRESLGGVCILISNNTTFQSILPQENIRNMCSQTSS